MFGPQAFDVSATLINSGNLGCDAVDDNKYVDKIVLIDRGVCEFTTKVRNLALDDACSSMRSQTLLEHVIPGRQCTRPWSCSSHRYQQC